MVRVLTYNVHSCVGEDAVYDVPRVASVLRRSACHVACLQEVEVNTKRRKQRTWSGNHADNQLEMVGKASGLRYLSFSAALCAYVGADQGCCEEVLVRDTAQPSSGFGNAVASSHPIMETRSLFFAQAAQQLSKDLLYINREAQPRGARAVLIDVLSADDGGGGEAQGGAGDAGGAGMWAEELEAGCCRRPASALKDPTSPRRALLWVVSTQLSDRAAEQRAQAQQLVEWVDGIIQEHKAGGEKVGVLVCGDFSASPLAPCSSYGVLSSAEGWVDLWKSQGSWFGQATYPAGCAPRCGSRLDHVFAVQREGLAKIRCESIRVLGTASARCPVIADVALDTAEASV